MEEDKKVDSMSCTADEVGAEGHMDGSRRGGFFYPIVCCNNVWSRAM